MCSYAPTPDLSIERMSVLWWSADGRYRRSSRRPGAARGPDPAVGTHAARSTPIPLSLECATHERGPARLMERRELLERLAPLIPPRGVHQVRYHGVLAPCASGRDRIVPGSKPLPGGSALGIGPVLAPDGAISRFPGVGSRKTEGSAASTHRESVDNVALALRRRRNFMVASGRARRSGRALGTAHGLGGSAPARRFRHGHCGA